MLTNKIWLPTALLFLLAIAADISIVGSRLTHYFPLGDEFSVIVGSNRPIQTWLTEGYSNYFNPYPEYFSPYSNFVRPLANAIYRIFSELHLSAQTQLVCVNLGLHASLSAILFAISRQFGNSMRFSFGIFLAAYLAPAFWSSPMPVFPAFAFDGLAALLCLSAIFLLASSSHIAGLILLSLAVLTKEPAIPVVFAVMFIAYLRNQSTLALAAALILAAWIGWRAATFGEFGGVYSLQHRDSIMMNLIGLVSVLFIPVTFVTINDVRSAFVEHQYPVSLIYMLVNFIIWLSCVKHLATNKAAIFHHKEQQTPFTNVKTVQYGIAGMLSAAAFFVLVRGEARLNYVFYALLLFVLSMNFPVRNWRNLTLGLILVASAVGSAKSMMWLHSIDAASLRNYEKSRELVGKIAHITPSRKTYVFNDFVTSFSSESSLAEFAQGTGIYARGSSLDISQCNANELQHIKTSVQHTSSVEMNVSITLPHCAHFQFEGADHTKIIEHLNGRHLARNNEIDYEFDEVRTRTSAYTGIKSIESFGSMVTARVRYADVLYYDFQNREWIYVH